MKASVICVVALLALACVASAQPATRRNATAMDEPMAAAPRRNVTGAVATVRNATAPAVAGARGANRTAAMNETAEPVMAGPKATEPMAAAGANTTANASAKAEPKKSSASVATTGFAAAVAGSVLLLQLVL